MTETLNLGFQRLEISDLVSSKCYLCSKTKTLTRCAVITQLICTFFAYFKRRASHDAAQMLIF